MPERNPSGERIPETTDNAAAGEKKASAEPQHDISAYSIARALSDGALDPEYVKRVEEYLNDEDH